MDALVLMGLFKINTHLGGGHVPSIRDSRVICLLGKIPRLLASPLDHLPFKFTRELFNCDVMRCNSEVLVKHEQFG